MPIFIYNSLTRKKEEFLPIKPPRVNIYTCGVTVYDESHIGHARSLYTFDVIRHYMKYRAFQVRFVRNITDIDDKIIKRANELKTEWKELIKKYIGRYYEDLDSLGIEKGDAEPRATENIEEMVKYIQALIEKGYAYESGGDVYFNVRKFSDYGRLSGQSIDQMETGVRIEPTEFKKDTLDFALWKASKEGEPSWDSPWGKGRPGWHIECSVMSQKYLNTETLDIHAGGRDLIFPHHENEIAQSEALTGKPFAKYWIHHGLLTINGQKMSKSLGNFVTIKDFMDRYKDADLLKFFFLSTHYAHPIDYNEGKVEEASKQKKDFAIFFRRVNLLAEGKALPEFSIKQKAKIDKLCDMFEQSMDNDFNTPQALSYLFELRDLALVLEGDAFNYARERLGKFFNILGLQVKPQMEITEEMIRIQRSREQAKKNKDFKEADRLRYEELRDRLKVNPSDTSTGVFFTPIEE